MNNDFVKETETHVQDLFLINDHIITFTSNLISQRIDAIFSLWLFLRFGDDYVESKSATVQQLLSFLNSKAAS